MKLQCPYSLGVQLLGLLVEGSALLDGAEALDLESRAGKLHCCDPWALLGPEAGLLAHDATSLVLHEVRLLEASLGLVELACEGMTTCEPGRDDLLLHGLHGFHGGHSLHGFHCLGHF